MCLLIFGHQVTQQNPLILAANRDEFHARPTRAARLWPEHPTLLAGQDLEQGGTWMGITRAGRFAAITNYRDPNQTRAAPLSRGELPLNFLIGSASPQAYLESLRNCADQYAGFNLLVGDTQSLWYFANSNADSPRELPPGLYGLSNAQLDTPWPKVQSGKQKLAALIDQNRLQHRDLETLVRDTQTAPPEDLRAFGMGSKMEQALSAQFIVTPEYGTRSTTTLLTHSNGDIHWAERSFDSTGAPIGVSELVLTN